MGALETAMTLLFSGTPVDPSAGLSVTVGAVVTLPVPVWK